MLWTLNFSEGWSGLTFFGQAKVEVKTFLDICLFTECSGVWIFWTGGALGPTFWSYQIWSQKIFRIFLFTKHSLLLISHWGWGSKHQLFWSHQIWGQKDFKVFLFIECFGLNFSQEGLGQLFLVKPNLRSNSFQNFFLYQVLWTLNFLGRRNPDSNYFWSHQIWSQKDFRVFLFIECSGLWIC